MTNQETIKILKPLFEQCKGKNGCLWYIEHFFTKNEEEAIDLAIKALEFDDVLDKIRAEIYREQYDFMSDGDYNEGIRFGLRLAYQIIDKYKGKDNNKEKIPMEYFESGGI